jgi:transcriptional regulator with XRE-family HTH domain
MVHSMSDSSREQPFQILGDRLKLLRQRLQESTAEVSGAVEIDTESLVRIEQGTELPSEDILMLLINHFGLNDDEAVVLWELAGYDQTNDQRSLRDDVRFSKQAVVLLALDARVIYSNGVEIVTDKSGVIMNFTQGMDKAQGNVPVSRVGMSYEQAERVLVTLQKALLHGRYNSDPAALPESLSSRNTKNHQKN